MDAQELTLQFCKLRRTLIYEELDMDKGCSGDSLTPEENKVKDLQNILTWLHSHNTKRKTFQEAPSAATKASRA